ncbi:MAG TPA: elongation factor G [Phycisphaerae bacterium]|nr:elongation factor G [Phycisphaerae bacterium]
MPAATSYRPNDIRNIVLAGHGGAGKTTLAEAMLHRCGVITRMGTVEDANTTSDFEPEARQHKHSTSTTLLFATHQNREINLIDTPGYPDFIGQALAALPAVETAVIVVNAETGIEVNTRRLYHAAGEMGLARMIVINKIDKVDAGRLEELVENLKTTFGPQLHCINLPKDYGRDVVDCFDLDHGSTDFGNVKAIHQEIVESVVEIDDTRMEKFLSGEQIGLNELRECFVKAMNAGHVVPILFTAAKAEVGIDDLLHILVEEAPSPANGRMKRLFKGEAPAGGAAEGMEAVEVPCDADKPLMAHVFKVTTDPYVGKLAMIRILQGKMDNNTQFICGDEKKAHKTGHVLKVEGRDHPEMNAVAYAGDLVALAKVEDIHVDQILHEPGTPNQWKPLSPKYPTPMFSLAIEPKARGDEVKISGALHKLTEEDPTFRSTHDAQTHEIVIHGVGELHLRVMLEKMKNRFNLEVTTKPPKIAYKETITAKAEGHYRHKKQTGGAGQFGEVFLRVEPLDRGQGFEFVNDVFGGSIPGQYIPSVEKGVHDILANGAIAGYPVQDIRVIITDGKHHPVDSKDIAFRTAGKYALKDAITKARPSLLEPIVNMEITVPERSVGDITGDLNGRRGRINGVDTLPGAMSLIRAVAPLAEVMTYNNQLRSVTSGQGSFVMEFSHYDVVPPQVQAKIVAAWKPKEEPE